MRILALLVLVGGWAAWPATAGEHTRDSLTKIQATLQQRKAVLVDVREQDEWNEGHLSVAQHLPLSRLEGLLRSGAVQKSLSRERIVYLHCAYGSRCVDAAKLLRQHGYDARPLKLGFEELAEAGLLTVK